VSEKAEQSVSAPAATSAPQKPAADAAPLNEPASPTETNAAPSLQTAPVSGSAMRKVDVDRARSEDKASGELLKQEKQKSATAGYVAQPAQSKPLQAAGKEAERASSNAVQAQSERRMKSAASPPRIDAAPAEPAAAAPEPMSAAKQTSELKDERQTSPTAFPAAPARVYAPAAPPPPAAAAASAPARETAAKPAPTSVDIEMNLYPEHWISDIRRMIKDGHRDDAIKNLAAFRKRYPDYTLPDDLRDLK
jgi:hypothetical protein